MLGAFIASRDLLPHSPRMLPLHQFGLVCSWGYVIDILAYMARTGLVQPKPEFRDLTEGSK
jgi:hypothetical protein